MLKSGLILRNINRTVGLSVCRTFSEVSATAEVGQKVGGFAEAYEKHTQSLTENDTKPKRAPLPFATLLKNSKFVDVSRGLQSAPTDPTQ